MYLYTGLEQEKIAALRREEQEEAKHHQPSGKLSASGLGEPVQWQILKALGVGKRQIDDYTLGKFAVGKMAEDWFLKKAAARVVERQKFVTYKGAVGYIDALIDTGSEFGIIPNEIKSTSNAKFKRIVQRGEPDDHHLLQAAFYGLARRSEFFSLTYIPTDDYRSHTWVYDFGSPTGGALKMAVDHIIDVYDEHIKAQIVPVFKARYPWQEKMEYNKFPEWMNLTEKEIKLALDYHYPTAWEDYHHALAAKVSV